MSVEQKHPFCGACGARMTWRSFTPGYSRATGEPIKRKAWVCSNAVVEDKQRKYINTGLCDGPYRIWTREWDDDPNKHYHGYIEKGWAE